jgi:hypothetical protein
MHSWEVEREFGFHLSPTEFKKFISTCTDAQLRVILESMGLLFRTVREIGAAEVALMASLNDKYENIVPSPVTKDKTGG